MAEFDYDLLVIGSGPAGQEAAIQAARLGKRVAIVERRTVVGGVCINVSTIPSKTLREAVLYLSGYREHELYGESYTVKQNIMMSDLLYRANHVIRHEIDVTRRRLARHGVEVLTAEAAFVDPHTVRLTYVEGQGKYDVTSAFFVIATGTIATRVPDVPFDGQRIFDSDDIMHLERIPRTLAVIGGGAVGCEYASIFATLGVPVTLIDKRSRLLPFVDAEITDLLTYHMRQNGVTLRLNEEVQQVEPVQDEHGGHVRICLASGKQVITDKVLYSIGRTGATQTLSLPEAGLTPDERGRIQANERYQTAVPHIYGAGDVIGSPSLASTSTEQGRLAACNAFGVEATSFPELFPYGIYTIPEISMVGRNEEELTSQAVPYEVGRAQYREIARGQIIGDSIGLMKLIFHLDTRKLLGVHIIGEGASELVHVGQAVMTFGGQVDYFINTVFNYPTLAECYKAAAFDGVDRLG
jgi:NAD(P) transhydrogenase